MSRVKQPIIIVFTMISSKMNSIYKHSYLNTLNQQLQNSLIYFCLSNDPYSSINRPFHLYPSTRRQPSNPNKSIHNKSTNKLDRSSANLCNVKLRYKSGRSMSKQNVLKICAIAIKVRRNGQNRDFTSQFDRHQITHFFNKSRHRTYQNIQKQTGIQITNKQVIKDVFCDMNAQTIPQINQAQTTSYISKLSPSQYEQSKIKGWSNQTIQRLIQQESNTHLSFNNIDSSFLLPVHFHQKQQNSHNSYQSRQEQSEISESQKDKEISIKTILPMFSIAIIPPSSSSCEEKTISLILNSDKNNQEQPSIKCVSSSNQFKVQLQRNEEKTSKFNCSLSKILPKQPSLKSIKRVSNHRLSIPVIQNQSQKAVNKVVMQQLSQNTNLQDSVPFLNTLRSHFDSRNKINTDFIPQKQHQKVVVFLKKSANKNNVEVTEKYDGKENRQDRQRGIFADVNKYKLNEQLIQEHLQIDLSKLNQL